MWWPRASDYLKPHESVFRGIIHMPNYYVAICCTWFSLPEETHWGWWQHMVRSHLYNPKQQPNSTMLAKDSTGTLVSWVKAAATLPMPRTQPCYWEDGNLPMDLLGFFSALSFLRMPLYKRASALYDYQFLSKQASLSVLCLKVQCLARVPCLGLLYSSSTEQFITLKYTQKVSHPLEASLCIAYRLDKMPTSN